MRDRPEKEELGEGGVVWISEDFRDAGRWRNRFRAKGKEFGGGH